MRGLQHLPLRQHEAGGRGHLAQRVELFGAGFLVDAEQQRGFLRDQRLGCADVGEDHEFLDQFMRVEPVLEGHAGDLAVLVQFDAPFRQIEVERLPPRARLRKGGVGGIKRLDDGFHQRGGLRVGRALHRRLRLFVGEAGDGVHHRAVEGVAGLVPLRIDLHLDRDAGAVDAFVQGTEVAGQRVGQHRHNAVGEIGGIAALARLAVQFRPRCDVMGHIGDGDPDGEAAVVVGRDVAGIVMVAGVSGVDGQQVHLAQVFAALDRRGLRGVSLCHHGIGEVVRDAVLVDRDEADGARPGGIAEARDDARLGQTHAALGAALLRLHQLAILCAAGGAGGDDVLAVGPLVDRHDAATLGLRAVYAEDAFGVGPDAADHPGEVGMRLSRSFGQAGKDAVARAQRRV